MAPQPHSFLLHLVGSGEFSDFTLICKDREFKLHQVIVCPQSPVISAALHSGFEEATSKVVTVNEFDVATVQSMVTFLYTGDYELAPETEKLVQDKDRDEKSEDGEDKTAEKIISQLRVNAIADYYNIAKLGKLSTSKIEAILRDDLNFLIIPQVIQEMSISNRDADLRSLIASATAKYIEELTSSQVLRALDLEHNLAIEILEACGRRIQELVEDASTARELQKIRERVSTLSIVKISSAIDLLKKTNRCRHCNNLFGCYIEEPTSVLTGGSAYVLRCESCGCRHS
ncbi:hypothetical protein FOQG_12801 [Fusarium oxysporum f. sp. raphani 54005]|uniref:BTB domain-containing protein n=1 Tax=Fusarium oxysporum f. sp. raphani 54005 TaxID=1089458 RepID=X0CJV5_FUSOX|nr:hypothetical protein FOQG_12801 [Fusarium oxysporum f. sp. raphani 54005]